MIVAERKPLNDIVKMVEPYRKVLILGCKGCVTVCNAGGVKEVGILASALKIAAKKEGKELIVGERTLERQCDPEYIEQVKDVIGEYEAVVSIACGVGPQFLAERYPETDIFPGVNTEFMGGALAHGVWTERCAGCGACLVHNFGGYCPIARCSKSLLNGPCGGSADGKCEIDKNVDCVWHLIVEKLTRQGKLDNLLQVQPPKSWTTARDGGPRKVIREDLAQ